VNDPLWPSEAIQWLPVSRRLLWLEQAHLAAWAGSMLTACVIAAFWLPAAAVWAAAAAVVVVGLIRAVTIVRSVRTWGYAERDVDLLVRHGLLVRRLSIVPYARMQFVDVTAGPLERALGLATVQMHTAAAASNARVPGLPAAAAAQLRDRLTALGEVHLEGL
jgi:uncharacterized protein